MRQKKTMEKAEATRAYLDAQDMGAAHKTIPNAKVGVMSSARIHLDRPLTEAEMKALVPVAEAHGFGVSDTGEGVTLMNFGDGPADGQGMKKLLTKGGLQAKLKAIIPDMGDVERTRLDALSSGRRVTGGARDARARAWRRPTSARRLPSHAWPQQAAALAVTGRANHSPARR